jgi:hypothetical protein
MVTPEVLSLYLQKGLNDSDMKYHITQHSYSTDKERDYVFVIVIGNRGEEVPLPLKMSGSSLSGSSEKLSIKLFIDLV